MSKSPKELKGLVATVVLSGTVKPQTAAALSELRSFNDRNGYHGVEYMYAPATLVEAGRDAVCMHALQQGYDYVLQIDADAAPFPADAIERALSVWYPSSYGVVGGYCQLRGPTGQPTIDTGSGTWEEHYPGQGIIPVIRTGAHFLFVKVDVFRLLPPPWFRTRIPLSPIRALSDVDNYARTTLGSNPLVDHPEWQTLYEQARRVSPQMSHVGEDSSFCDTLIAHGVRIGVDTDCIVGHVSDEIIMPERFVTHMRKMRSNFRLALGVME